MSDTILTDNMEQFSKYDRGMQSAVGTNVCWCQGRLPEQVTFSKGLKATVQLTRQTSQEARGDDLLWATCRINLLNSTPFFLHLETRFSKDASLI